MRAAVCVLIVLAAANFLAAAGFPARAESCDDDTIDHVSDDGKIIKMTSGATFRVSSSDQIDAALWLSGEDVMICEDDTELINKDENEHVAVRRIR